MTTPQPLPTDLIDSLLADYKETGRFNRWAWSSQASIYHTR